MEKIDKTIISCILYTTFNVILLFVFALLVDARINELKKECLKMEVEYNIIKHELGVWEETNNQIVYMAQHDWEIDTNDMSVRDMTWK